MRLRDHVRSLAGDLLIRLGERVRGERKPEPEEAVDFVGVTERGRGMPVRQEFREEPKRPDPPVLLRGSRADRVARARKKAG